MAESMADLTVVIPSRNEIFLKRTIEDVLEKARGDIAIYPVLDGYDIPEDEIVHDPRVNYVRLPTVGHTQKRHAINKIAAETSGRFIMSLDAHCMMDEGFDVKLEESFIDGSVMIPRRNRLDAVNWSIQIQSDSRPSIDYEYTMWPLKFDKPGLHGFRWDERTFARSAIQIDETMHFQGSCWFMEREFFHRMGFMQIDGYTGWGQEAEEIGLKTWRAGGQVLTNKTTWYAHLHKGATYGRMWYMSKRDVDACNAYSFNYWVHENKEFFAQFIEKFWPVPGWPPDWRKRLWGE
jgi:hypothetical protein